MPLLLIVLSCSGPGDDALSPIVPAKLDRTTAIDFTGEIAPLFTAKCSGCHSAAEAKGGFRSTSHADILKGGTKGSGVVAGKPSESRVYLLASHTQKPIMPPRSENDPLTEREVALLKLWIEQGAAGPKGDDKPRRTVTLSPPLVKPVRALAMHGDRLAIGRGNQLILADVRTGESTTFTDPNLKTTDGKPANAAHISLVESLALSPDGTILASGSFREVTLWSIEKRLIIARLNGFADKVTAIGWSPNGKLFATAGGAPTEDGEIRIFNDKGQSIRDFKSPHSDTVFGIAFSPDGSMLASASADKFVRVFEIPSGKLLKSLEGHTQHVLDVGWSTDGKRIISAGADDLIKFWNLETGEKTRDLRGTTKQVMRLAFVQKSPAFFSVGGDAIVRRWSTETGDPSRTFNDARDALYAVATNADGTTLATGGEEGLVRIYDAKTGQMKTLLASSK